LSLLVSHKTLRTYDGDPEKIQRHFLLLLRLERRTTMREAALRGLRQRYDSLQAEVDVDRNALGAAGFEDIRNYRREAFRIIATDLKTAVTNALEKLRPIGEMDAVCFAPGVRESFRAGLAVHEATVRFIDGALINYPGLGPNDPIPE